MAGNQMYQDFRGCSGDDGAAAVEIERRFLARLRGGLARPIEAMGRDLGASE